jgi:hypothetical protein
MKSTFRLFIGCIAFFALFSFSSDKQASLFNQKHGVAEARAFSTITLTLINNRANTTVYLVNSVTGDNYQVGSSNGSNGYLYNLPEGVYSVYINPTFADEWKWYTIGCNPEFEQRGEVWMDEVTFDSDCNTIYIN